MGNWKYITPTNSAKIDQNTGIELGQDTIPQLYDIINDSGEKINVARKYPEKVKELTLKLEDIE
jgi:hypothetical protein